MVSTSPIRRWCRRRLLGSGSFAEVCLAVNNDTGGYFVVKSTLCCCPEAVQAMETELRILQTLQSERIISCLGSEVCREGNGMWSRNLFLEYMDGGSLADLVKSAGDRLPEDAVRRYTRGVVEGLAYLHDQGIVHCDIKGQNVLVGSGGRSVKIADFGAAKRFCDYPSSTTGSFKGTPLWMAPEVLNGVDQSFASDIWSLGITVCEMLCGYPLWKIDGSDSSSTSIGALLFKIARSEENPVLPPGISYQAADFLSKCLNRDPRRRWTAAQLMQHPFLLDEARHSYTSASPRSTLDHHRFLQSDSDCSDEDETMDDCSSSSSNNAINAETTISGTSSAHTAVDQSEIVIRSGSAIDWMTVRQNGDTSAALPRRSTAFFAAPDGGLQVVKEMNLDYLQAFVLQARMRKVARVLL